MLSEVQLSGAGDALDESEGLNRLSFIDSKGSRRAGRDVTAGQIGTILVR